MLREEDLYPPCLLWPQLFPYTIFITIQVIILSAFLCFLICCPGFKLFVQSVLILYDACVAGTDSLPSDLNQLSLRGRGSGSGGMWSSGTHRASPSPDTTTPSSPSFTSTSADALSATILSGVSTERKRNLGGNLLLFLFESFYQYILFLLRC